MLKATFLGFLGLLFRALAVDVDANPSLNDKLLLATTCLDRWNILNGESNNPWKYDFSTNPMWPQRNSPGSVCNANKATWPALQGIGATVAQLNLGPCSMLPPHYHRDANVVVAIAGSTHTMMIQENGAGVVMQDLTPGQATIFPRASVHTMVNNGCTPNQLYSFLPGDDPGTVNVINSMMMLGQDVGEVIMPWMVSCPNVQSQDWNTTSSQVPPIGSGSNSWTQECLTRCNIPTSGRATRRFVVY